MTTKLSKQYDDLIELNPFRYRSYMFDDESKLYYLKTRFYDFVLRIGMVKVRFPVPEQEIARLGTDSRLRITVAALGDRAFPAGKIEKGAVANPATHTYDVRATLSNADGELLPGMVCRVEASPAGAAEEIALPVRAVQQAGDGSRFVWKVSGDSVVRTAVATGRLVNNAVTITAGIQAGDRIVTDGMQKIGQGSKVIAE